MWYAFHTFSSLWKTGLPIGRQQDFNANDDELGAPVTDVFRVAMMGIWMGHHPVDSGLKMH